MAFASRRNAVAFRDDRFGVVVIADDDSAAAKNGNDYDDDDYGSDADDAAAAQSTAAVTPSQAPQRRRRQRYVLYVAFLHMGHTDVEANKYNRINAWLSGGIVHTDLHFAHNMVTCSVGAAHAEESVFMFEDKEFSRSGWAFYSARLPADVYFRIYEYCLGQYNGRVRYNRTAYDRFLCCPVHAFSRAPEGRRGHLCASLVAEALDAGGIMPYGDEIDVRELHAGHVYTLLATRPDVWRRSEHVVHAYRDYERRANDEWQQRLADLPEAVRARLVAQASATPAKSNRSTAPAQHEAV